MAWREIEARAEGEGCGELTLGAGRGAMLNSEELIVGEGSGAMFDTEGERVGGGRVGREGRKRWLH